jgi:hypothetical protein
MPQNPETNRSPFSPEAFEADVGDEYASNNDRIAELVDDPNRLVRFIPYESVGLSREEALELIKAGREEFALLSNEYGLNVVDFEIIVGRGDGEKFVDEEGAYYIVSKIEGESLQDLVDKGSVNAQMTSKVDSTFAGVMKYFIDKLESGEPGVWGIYWRQQYVYGVESNSDDGDSKVWLVDIDPRLESGEVFRAKINKAYMEFGRD